MIAASPAVQSPRAQLKNRLRAWRRHLRLAWVRAFRAYDAAQLQLALRRLGVQPGDALMVHSMFEQHHGFRGTVPELIDALQGAVGAQGTLLMVSMAYRASTLEYLGGLRAFDVRRTPSAMGLISELFRRRAGVRRSLSASHPVLASGADADWFVAGHERCVYPCGPDSPFARLLARDGQVLFLNVPFDTFTFLHHLEHLVSDALPFPLYHQPPFAATVVDADGNTLQVPTHAFSAETLARRHVPILAGWLRERGLLRELRLGASTLLCVRVREVVQLVLEKKARGEFFYREPVSRGAH